MTPSRHSCGDKIMVNLLAFNTENLGSIPSRHSIKEDKLARSLTRLLIGVYRKVWISSILSSAIVLIYDVTEKWRSINLPLLLHKYIFFIRVYVNDRHHVLDTWSGGLIPSTLTIWRVDELVESIAQGL